VKHQAPAGGRRAATIALYFGAATAWLAPTGGALAQTHAGQYEQADIEYGARLYAERCVVCHGERGDLMPGANLASGSFRNAPTDRDLMTVIRNGIPGTAMTATGYSEAEATALVAYLRNMATFDASGVVIGDEERGRALYEAKGDCESCHRIAGRGPRFAPDLTQVGTLRTAATLQRTLVDPDGGMVPINRPVRAITRDGTAINGRRVNEDTFTVQLVDEEGRLVTLDKADLREYRVDTAAAMPSYAEVFTEQERADLVAYLLSLKGFD
jgi:putative heme-binding domain-containing protein